VSETRIWKTFFNDLEKEEAWLNEMAAKGLDLVVPGKLGPPPYRFEQGAPGEWTYRIQILPGRAGKPATRRYLEFMSETGIETVAAIGFKAYFRKPTSEGAFDIFSDLESRVAQVRRLRWWLIGLALPQLLTIAALTSLLFGPSTQPDPLPVRYVVTVLVLSLIVEAMVVAQTARESRRIKSLEEQRRLFE
jgi:hypothetical protein